MEGFYAVSGAGTAAILQRAKGLRAGSGERRGQSRRIDRGEPTTAMADILFYATLFTAAFALTGADFPFVGSRRG